MRTLPARAACTRSLVYAEPNRVLFARLIKSHKTLTQTATHACHLGKVRCMIHALARRFHSNSLSGELKGKWSTLSHNAADFWVFKGTNARFSGLFPCQPDQIFWFHMPEALHPSYSAYSPEEPSRCFVGARGCLPSIC